MSEKAARADQSVRKYGRQAGRAAERAGRGVSRHEHTEGQTTKAIEYYTSQVPSGTYLSLALGSMALSAAFHLYGRKKDANFVGQWVPTILILGLYNKLVKLEGSE